MNCVINSRDLVVPPSPATPIAPRMKLLQVTTAEVVAQ